MKKKFLNVLILASGISYAQVGINQQSPKATLDIVAKATDGTTAEGIIAPRLSGDELKGKDLKYSADQTGALVYVTSAVTTASTVTDEVTAAGYYYFNGTKWKAFSGATSSSTAKNVTDVKTGNYTALATDDIILLNPSSLGLVLTLPTTGIPIGKTYYISNNHPSYEVLISPGLRENGVVAAQPAQGTIVMYIGGTGNGSYSNVSGY